MVQDDREGLKQTDYCVEVKAAEIIRGNNINQQSKRIRLFFQYCLYAHWKSAHNRSIVSVITDSIPVTALQLNEKLVLHTEMTTERTKSVGQPTKWGFRKQLTPQTLKLENSCLQNMNKYSIESS